jgi:hypothetical protein
MEYEELRKTLEEYLELGKKKLEKLKEAATVQDSADREELIQESMELDQEWARMRVNIHPAVLEWTVSGMPSELHNILVEAKKLDQEFGNEIKKLRC